MAPLLALDGVGKTYFRGLRELRVLTDASMEVCEGDFVAVFGSRSAGKSTLLRIAAGLEEPDTGRVLFDGRDLAELNASRLAALHRSEIGWVDRSGPRGDEMTMRDYVALPLYGGHRHGAARRAAETALESVGALDCAAAHWDDLGDTERAQVSLAHALVRKPRLLVLDDPTAGLDILDRERIVTMLRRLADESRVGVLMAVPDMPAMLRAHEVFTLSDGRLLSAPEPPPNRGKVVAFPGSERSA